MATTSSGARRRPAGLGAALVLIAIATPRLAIAAEWTFSPRVQVRSTYSDNVRLLPSGQEQGDLVNELEPGFALTAQGRRLNLHLDYGLDDVSYRSHGENDSLLHSLNGDLLAELLDDTLFIDARAQIGQQNISAFGPQFADNTTAGANRAQVQTYHLSPYLRQHLSNVATAEWRYAADAFISNSDALANTRTRSVTLDVHSGPAFQNLDWSVQLRQQRIAYAGAGTQGSTHDEADLRQVLFDSLALTASAGYERYGYLALRDAPEGAFWSAGLSWRPSPRTTVEWSGGHHFYGPAYALTARHRARHGLLLLSYHEDITTTQAQQQQGSLVDSASFLNQLWSTIIPDPGARQDAVTAFLRDTGFPSQMPASINAFSNRYFLEKRLQASLALQGARQTAMLSAYSSRRQVQSTAGTGALASAPLLTLDGAQDSLQLGVDALWHWRIGEHTEATASFAADRVSLPDAARIDHHRSLRLALSRQLSRQLRASLELRHLDQRSSAGASQVRENAIAISLQASF